VAIRLENWDDTVEVAFDRTTLNELASLRFVDAGHNALILGPVGVGKTFLATTLSAAPALSSVSPSSPPE
jgi:DNA replication protein DnaC